jgi:dethiobiotin synthetase
LHASKKKACAWDSAANKKIGRHITKYAKGVETKCFWQFSEPISPHLAAPKTLVSLDSPIFVDFEA